MRTYIFLGIFAVVALAAHTSAAQFTIKLPKLPKASKPADPPQSNTQTPSGDRTSVNDSPDNNNATQRKVGSGAGAVHRSFIQKPLPTNVPVLMKDTLGIDAKTNSLNYFSKWVPQVQFGLFYDGSVKLRYVAEWYKPDGTLWYSEPLELYPQQTENLGYITLRSPDADDVFKANAINAVGVYGVKVKNSKTDQVVFEGKFKVNKVPDPEDPKQKNYFRFYVDHDWLMNLGYAGYNIDSWSESEMYPAVMMWFKGSLDGDEFEAVLLHDGKQIATTDKGGSKDTIQVRGGMCYSIREVCQFHLWRFTWNTVLLPQPSWVKTKYPNAVFAGETAGEFTVKVFYKGEQVRETKFTLAADGSAVRDPLSDGVYSAVSLIPVKVMGNLEKWVPNTWKTNMFYGNPLSGFSVQ